ncbi:fatty acid desaturase [Kitasatospora sp. NBC_01250]|uniref:fatty acid desaturase n=1 Tax=unclassified Kitasatospora TaxID=2633591 RepID=UPI002E1232E5|nr:MULTISPECIES: fatty acid desaturase [unclassified Kitasatospora]WSJ65119.1 fatty acid desaturase [Kitasatospora sp. NBC_01302]
MRSEVYRPFAPAAGHEAADDPVRESMRRLPAAFALPLTLLTGRPLADQPRTAYTPTRHLVNASVSVTAGLAAGALALAAGRWWLLLVPVGWAMTLHGARNLRMMVYHQCAHLNMWGHKRRDVLLGRTIAALLVIQDFGRYSTEHVSDHHAVHHMTLRDPTVQAFLVSLGLRPGMSRREMWRRTLLKTVSPVFHARFLTARIRSYFHSAEPAWRTGTALGWVAVAGLATLLHLWVLLLVAWVVPMTVLYQVSNTFRLCVKHTFPAPDEPVRRGRDYFAALTNAIFIGEAAPPPGLPPVRRAAAWARWGGRMLLVHFPARYLVLTGDTVVHDFHHRAPMSRDWANYLFAREDDHRRGHPGWPAYHHVWGLVAAIDLVFDSLRHADPEEYHPDRLAEVNHRELFAAFED